MIGVFDSGYGGLTVLKELVYALPEYDYLYLGDNARAPYGSRSFEVVHRFTLQAVRYLMDVRRCPLVILACNTASAKALRTIQQTWLPVSADPTRRVLGVIRPTAEAVGSVSHTRHIGVVATPGTINSGSYDIEIAKLHPDMTVTGHACPMWAPLVECGEAASPGADYFVNRDVNDVLARDPQIDTLVLACTHYPLLLPKIRKATPENVALLTQGQIVARSLEDYLQRHPEMQRRLTQGGTVHYLTTDNPERFAPMAQMFMGTPVTATQTTLS